MSNRKYLGIDNGLTGALVLLDEDGGIESFLVMPTRDKTRGNEVDALAVAEWIAESTRGVPLTVILETPGKFSPGVQALTSMWDSYGALRAVLELMQLRHVRINSQKWQKAMLVGCAKGDTKPAALAMAKRLWPHEKFLATIRSTVPHQGLVDASLIGEYGRRNSL